MRLICLAVIGLCSTEPAASRSFTENFPNNADVVVIGATPAGIAAAIAASRGGVDVLLVEETHHVGGVISGGLTSADIGNDRAVGGFFNEFRRRVREYYAARYGVESEQYKDCRDGNRPEPYVAEIVFRRMLAEQPRIQLLMDHYVERADVARNQLVSVSVRRADRSGKRQALAGKVFIDATYEGDLAAAAGVRYRVGRESRDEYGESLGGRIYTRIGSRDRLAGSTGAADAGIQAYCFRVHITADPANRVPFQKPRAYRRGDYRHLLADIKAGRITRLEQIVQFKPGPNAKIELNSNHLDAKLGAPSESFDLAEENWAWPEASRRERRRILERYWSYQEGLLWFLQTDAEVPAALREETARYGFARDEFVDNNHRPHHLYVRQGRRIVGEYVFTQREEDPDPHTGRLRQHYDSVAVAAYHWDSHAVHKYDPVFPLAREGYFVVPHPPLQVPFRVMVPKEIDALLVPVAVSASHVGYQTIRMEPVLTALGQAAGIAAAQAIRKGIPVRAASIQEVRAEILRQQGVIAYVPSPTISQGSRREGILVHRVESMFQTAPTSIRVLVPDNLRLGMRYRVIYVLPVETLSETHYGDGLLEVRQRNLHNLHEVIFVAPTFSDLPWYADHPINAAVGQESYLLKDVVPFIDKTYPTRTEPDGRLLLGFSKSGWGAWTLLLRHPALFGRAAAWDAPMMMSRMGKYGNAPIFGTQENFERYLVADLLRMNAGKLGAQPRLILTGYDIFRQEHEEVRALMNALHIPHVYRDGPQLKHHWHSGWVAEAVSLLLASP